MSTESTRAASRKARVYVFREFLLNTYGSYLSEGCCVLDVAGGKGDLSWLLCNIDGLDSVVIDPRKTNDHILKSVKYLKKNPSAVHERSIPGLPTYQPLAPLVSRIPDDDSLLRSPRHMRIYVNEDLVQNLSSALTEGGNESAWEAFWKESLQESQDNNVGAQGNQIFEARDAIHIFRSARLIVGFHPDQATDYIVNIAALLRIPLCIVPCCVFPKEFPWRKLTDGRHVKHYKEYIEYLSLMIDGGHRAHLDFHFTESSRNIVLYTFPDIEAAQRNS